MAQADQVEIGQIWEARVSGKLTDVEILGEAGTSPSGRKKFQYKNLKTGRAAIGGAGKLKTLVRDAPGPAPAAPPSPSTSSPRPKRKTRATPVKVSRAPRQRVARENEDYTPPASPYGRSHRAPNPVATAPFSLMARGPAMFANPEGYEENPEGYEENFPVPYPGMPQLFTNPPLQSLRGTRRNPRTAPAPAPRMHARQPQTNPDLTRIAMSAIAQSGATDPDEIIEAVEMAMEPFQDRSPTGYGAPPAGYPGHFGAY